MTPPRPVLDLTTRGLRPRLWYLTWHHGLSLLLGMGVHSAGAADASVAAPSASAVTPSPLSISDGSNGSGTAEPSLDSELHMFAGESRVIPLPGLSRVAIGSPAVATATVLNRQEVLLFANGAGSTSVLLWHGNGQLSTLKLIVNPADTQRIAREIAAFVRSIPGVSTAVIGDKVIIEGEALSDADLARIDLLATRYPQLVNFTNRLGMEQMVRIDVKVVEMPTQALKETGLRWSAVGGAAIGSVWSPWQMGSQTQNGGLGINLQTGNGNLAPMVGPAGPVTMSPTPSGMQGLGVMNMGLNGLLSALEREGSSSILAQPQLSTRSGSKASFLAGGELPYSMSSLNGTTVQFKPYGVRLDVTPKVDRKGHIRASIETEVSNVDASVSGSAGPGLLTRKTSTEFHVRSGETIVLAGLVQREQSRETDGVPGLSRLPVLGALFRSKRLQTKDTELVIFVTPTVMPSATEGTQQRMQRMQERLDRWAEPLREPRQ